MARTYAAIMALVAMLVVFTRALKNHAGLEQTLPIVAAWMALFGAIGFILGILARQAVDHSVQQIVETELAAISPQTQDKEAVATAASQGNA